MAENPVLNIKVRKDRGTVEFGRLVPMCGNTYGITVTGVTDPLTFFVMDDEQKTCLAKSVTESGATTISFNTKELRAEFEREWHELRVFHTLVSDGTNTIAEGDLTVAWNPGWTDAATGEVYSFVGPQGPQGVGISSIVFDHYDAQGNSVYNFTLTEGSHYEVVIRKGDRGIGVVNFRDLGPDAQGNKHYVFVLSDGSEKEIVCPKGERGPQGFKGDTGPQGERGEKGETGAQGERGEKGEQGEKGDQGERGERGFAGDGSYVFDENDRLWHNVTVWTDPDTGEKTVQVNQDGTPTRPVIGDTFVESVNGMHGVVVLYAEDVGALPESFRAVIEGRVTVIEGRVTAVEERVDDAEDDIDAIEEKIPSQASASNQLADKDFVNSSIATNTAFFRGTSAAGLSEAQFLAWANTLTKTNNDYIFWNTTDGDGNVVFKRYKYNGTAWVYEYTLNNSSFTAEQWATVNSGLTAEHKAKIESAITIAEVQNALYPVGSIYTTISASETCPLGFGTWEKIAEGKCLFGTDVGVLFGATDAYQPGTTIPQGLPKPTIDQSGLSIADVSDHNHTFSSAYSSQSKYYQVGEYPTYVDTYRSGGTQTSGNGGAHTHDITGSVTVNEDDTYKETNTIVQPPAIAVVFWKRTA